MIYQYIKKVQAIANAKRMANEVNLFLSGIKEDTEIYERTIDFKLNIEDYINKLKNK